MPFQGVIEGDIYTFWAFDRYERPSILRTFIWYYLISMVDTICKWHYWSPHFGKVNWVNMIGMMLKKASYWSYIVLLWSQPHKLVANLKRWLLKVFFCGFKKWHQSYIWKFMLLLVLSSKPTHFVIYYCPNYYS